MDYELLSLKSKPKEKLELRVRLVWDLNPIVLQVSGCRAIQHKQARNRNVNTAVLREKAGIFISDEARLGYWGSIDPLF